jgi:hypothetical protein
MKKRYDAKFKTKVVLEALREYIHVRETGCPFSYILEVAATFSPLLNSYRRNG